MKRGCPNSFCIFYQKKDFIKKDGRYFRKNDSRWIQRYRCQNCGKKFSKSTFELECGHKKRRINFPLLKLLTSGVSMRRSAMILGVNKNTIPHKVNYLAKKARLSHQCFLKKLQLQKVRHLQFDDLITIEHTKLKPLTVSAAVCADRRYFLGAKVASIPAFGPLARLSRKKYGPRANHHRQALQGLFDQIAPVVAENGLIQSDEHMMYPPFVRHYFPQAQHIRHKGGRSSVVGLGELKRKKFDPIFIVNHSYAMLRANINRLFRRTWCTTKDPQMLQNHLDIYIDFHNRNLV